MDKLQQFVTGELDALREKGVFNRPRVLETEQKATVVIDGHEVITLSSNNYLGLTVHPRLREAASPVSTAGSTPAPPAVGAATITPIAAFTS